MAFSLLKGPAELTEDLLLSQHHGVDPGRDPEKMRHRIQTLQLQSGQIVSEQLGRDPLLVRDSIQQDFDPVTGGQEDSAAGPSLLLHRENPGENRLPLDDEILKPGEGGEPVVGADEERVHHERRNCPVAQFLRVTAVSWCGGFPSCDGVAGKGDWGRLRVLRRELGEAGAEPSRLSGVGIRTSDYHGPWPQSETVFEVGSRV